MTPQAYNNPGLIGLNSSKWKPLSWLVCYVNCYVFFNRLLLLTRFLILAFYNDYFSFMQLYVETKIRLKVHKPSPLLATYDWLLKFHISNNK